MPATPLPPAARPVSPGVPAARRPGASADVSPASACRELTPRSAAALQRSRPTSRSGGGPLERLSRPTSRGEGAADLSRVFAQGGAQAQQLEEKRKREEAVRKGAARLRRSCAELRGDTAAMRAEVTAEVQSTFRALAEHCKALLPVVEWPAELLEAVAPKPRRSLKNVLALGARPSMASMALRSASMSKVLAPAKEGGAGASRSTSMASLLGRARMAAGEGRAA